MQKLYKLCDPTSLVMTKRYYSRLIVFDDFDSRFEYLKLDGIIGKVTFGSRRPTNQTFYRSIEWRRVRDHVIVRDNGCDLGVDGFDIIGTVLVHHMNPITELAILERNKSILDPEFLVCVSIDTHNAIHYGDGRLLRRPYVERSPGDTHLW